MDDRWGRFLSRQAQARRKSKRSPGELDGAAARNAFRRGVAVLLLAERDVGWSDRGDLVQGPRNKR